MINKTIMKLVYIKDTACTKETPIIYGNPDKPIYGSGKRIKPHILGRSETEHMKKILLPELLPLEEYDLVVILLSGGKDSIACYYKLLELGVPKEKMEFWHHDIDGGHPYRRIPALFAGYRELYPEEFEQLKQDEKNLGFTLDNKSDLETFIGNAKSCVYHGDKEAIHSLITGEFGVGEIYVTGEWKYPAGAFHGAEGGPC